MAGKKAKRRVARRGIKVTAVTTDRGPPSTAVHVELKPDELKEEVGEYGRVKRVSAEVPQQDRARGEVRWEEEPMRPVGRSPGAAPEPVERYAAVHYGPSEAKRLGVGVSIETDAGKIRGQGRGESYTVGEPDRPGTSERKKKPD